MMTPHPHVRAWPVVLAVFAAGLVAPAWRSATALTPRLSDSGDVALALSAAPASLSGGAAVYVWRDGQFAKVREGTTGFACMVTRDTRTHSVSPECFDPEAARTLMQEEMMETRLRARGLSDQAIDREVDAAYQRGTLHHPEHGGIIYMMSSKQELVTSPESGSRPIGAWHPHLMIYIPHASASQFALGADGEAGPVSTPFHDKDGVLLVVQVPHWSDSQAVVDETAQHRDAGSGGVR